MASLTNQSQNFCLSSDLKLAEKFNERLIGLMGSKALGINQALWIKKCNSIQTCFMRFSIDAIFVDKNLVIKNIYKNIVPWRVTKLNWGSDSVFEFTAGSELVHKSNIGDQLSVDT